MLGGVESLAELPEKMTHGSIPPAERLALSITPDLEWTESASTSVASGDSE
ncbi:hypothetical protein M422DRAFT_267195 [Sphaerobolus stellatus SS14]|uniref:Uncharacterized protein n=1 Tax=Sphaerobolus stellatus (strain SS14) TaxID=990650 RepID=A0A0C9U9E4_SPHS4|nr:hypothetical protein M422DRAFT_267195 [Sphaerobolus stellatus SS14]